MTVVKISDSWRPCWFGSHLKMAPHVEQTQRILSPSFQQVSTRYKIHPHKLSPVRCWAMFSVTELVQVRKEKPYNSYYKFFSEKVFLLVHLAPALASKDIYCELTFTPSVSLLRQLLVSIKLVQLSTETQSVSLFHF